MGSGLTPKQKRLIKELYDISSVIGMDYWEIEEYPKESRTSILELQKRQAITGRIIMQYTLIDDMVGSEICKYFLYLQVCPAVWPCRCLRFTLLLTVET